MKEMNRREFLTLTGASVALLALAACGGLAGRLRRRVLRPRSAHR